MVVGGGIVIIILFCKGKTEAAAATAVSQSIVLQPTTMEVIQTLDQDCSALAGLFQMVVNDMKVSKLHLKVVTSICLCL